MLDLKSPAAPPPSLAPAVPAEVRVRIVAIDLSAWQWAKVMAAIAVGQLILAALGALLLAAGIGLVRG